MSGSLESLLPGLIQLTVCIIIVITGIARRVLVERKLRVLLPGKTLRRISVFHHIDPKSLPDTPAGREFSAYYKRISVNTLAIVGAALFIMIVTGSLSQ